MSVLFCVCYAIYVCTKRIKVLLLLLLFKMDTLKSVLENDAPGYAWRKLPQRLSHIDKGSLEHKYLHFYFTKKEVYLIGPIYAMDGSSVLDELAY